MAKFIGAVLILSGMIIGAGMFGIPFSFNRAGFGLGILELVILAGVILILHLLYGEIVLKTPEFHRLPGYVRVHLGKGAALLSWFSAFFGISLSLLAYVLLGSVFLNNIFSALWRGSQESWWAILVVLAGALVTLFPLKKEALINGILTAFLIIFTIALIVLLFPKAHLTNIGGFNLKEVFLPYGVLLFALSGGTVIPDLLTYLGRERKKARLAIMVGTLIPALVYFFFAFTVVGVAGNGVSEEALRGLTPLVSRNLVILGDIIGFLAVFTSFITLSKSFQALLKLDFKWPVLRSWLMVSLIPAILYFLGLQNFIGVIGTVGAVSVGIDTATVIASHHRLRIKEGYTPTFFSYFWRFAIYAMVATGVLYELYRFLFS